MASSKGDPLAARGRERPGPRRERQVFVLALVTALPGLVLAWWLLWLAAPYDPVLRWSLGVGAAGLTGLLAYASRARVARNVMTLASMLGALREGDFSVRGRGANVDDAFGLALHEVNELSEMLQKQRLGALEATALLRRVMEEAEIGIFAFDPERRLRLISRHGEEILGRPAERLLGLTAAELGLGACLEGEAVRTIELELPGQGDRFLQRRSVFRQSGVPHELVVLSDARRALREEENLAWQKLVRVLSHEINNSLAPISSVAGSLARLLRTKPRPDDWEQDMSSGLDVIGGRSAGLRRIMASYARLAKLPPPSFEDVPVATWVRRVAAIETRVSVDIEEGPELTIRADGDQLDQLLINLVGNAVDASLETKGSVRVGWRQDGEWLRLWIDDQGLGIADRANLFVPFFTTKPEGSGIGLLLSRQIAEAHGGELQLRNREGGPGARAELRIPIGKPL